jgi:hypothetical protein
MKLSGDIPVEHIVLAEKITIFEREVDEESLSIDRKAQIYVCLAFDWYSMDSDENGQRLLLKAEDTYPGYFKDKIKEHAKENQDFDLIVKKLTKELIFLFMDRLSQ